MIYSQFKSLVKTWVATLTFEHTHHNIFLSAHNSWYQHAKKQTIHHSFYYRFILGPIFHTFQKPYFRPIFGTIFFHKIWLSHKSSYGPLTPFKVSEKTILLVAPVKEKRVISLVPNTLPGFYFTRAISNMAVFLI